MVQKNIVALGGRGFPLETDALDEYVINLTGKVRPKMCFLPTATGDSAELIGRYYESGIARATEAIHLELFHRTVRDIRSLLLAQDMILVGGGNTANMMAVWRVHGVDEILREAWEQGIVLWGSSAGSICWFECGVTDSYHPSLDPVYGTLGFLMGSNCPHYDSEAERRPKYHRFIKEGLPGGLAAEDHVGFHFVGTKLHKVITPRPDGKAFRVAMNEAGAVVEEELDVTVLPSVSAGQLLSK